MTPLEKAKAGRRETKWFAVGAVLALINPSWIYIGVLVLALAVVDWVMIRHARRCEATLITSSPAVTVDAKALPINVHLPPELLGRYVVIVTKGLVTPPGVRLVAYGSNVDELHVQVDVEVLEERSA